MNIPENEDQKFKLQGRISFKGLDIAVENKPGSIRRGMSDDGEEWKTKMFYHYGYIRRTLGVDGDPVDVYVGKNKDSDKVFIIHQVNPQTGKYDEDKVMLGFDSQEAARDAYLSHYDTHEFLGKITEMSFEEFKKKVFATKKEPKMIKSIIRKLFKAFGQQISMFDSPGEIMEGQTRLKDGKLYEIKRSKKNPQVKRLFRTELPEVHKTEPKQELPKEKDNSAYTLFNQPISFSGSKDTKPKDTKPKEKKKQAILPDKAKNSGESDMPIDLFNQPIEIKTDPKKDELAGIDEFGISHIEKTVRKQRIEINKKVRSLLAGKKDNEFTDDDKKLLAQYSGRGGTDEVSLNEYYTPDYVAKFQWNMMKKLGYKGGNVLEPSCATGIFLHTAPENTLVTGIEFDETSSRIAQILFPDHDVHNMSFEKYNKEDFDRGFQGAIGNVPFGIRGATAADDPTKINLKTHEQYFLDRIVDDLEDGGVASIIVPTGVMDNQINEFRLDLNKKAEFLGAIRMPTGVFAKSGAQVTTDIVFFKKRPDEVIEKLQNLKRDELLKLFEVQILDSDFVAGTFFKKNPEFALGNEAQGMFGQIIRKGNITEQDLEKAGEFIKDFEEDYSVLGDLDIGIPDEKELMVGDIKVWNGRTYQLNENHRWERLTEDQAKRTVLPKEMQDLFGIKTYDQLEELKNNKALHFDLTREQLAELDTRYRDELPNYTDKELNSNEKLKRAFILGLEIRQFQKDIQNGKYNDDASLAQRKASQIILMLDEFSDKYGNPVLDKSILKNLGKSESNPLLYLAGSFNSDGDLSKIFSDPLGYYNVYKSKAGIGKLDVNDLNSIVQYFYDNGIPSNLDTIKSYSKQDEGTLEKDLLQEENIYIDEKGNYAPLVEVCMGEVYNKLDYWEERKKQNQAKLNTDISDEEKEKLVLENKKLEDQIYELKRRAKTKNIEELPVSMKDAGTFFDDQILNDYLNEVIPNDMRGEIHFDKKRNLVLFADDEYAEAYTLYASKGSNDKEDTDLLKRKMKRLFGSEENPKLFLMMNKINNIPLTIRGEKAERMEEELSMIENNFRKYLAYHNDAAKIADKYNRAYNNYIQKSYDTAPIEGITKFDYDRVITTTPEGRQVTAREKAGEHTYAVVRRMYEQGKGMIAHGVGLGKTLEGILLTLLSKQTGKAKKPLIVTPKSVLINWAAEIDKWTKDVNYLVVGFSKKNEDKGWTADNIREDTADQKKLKLMQASNNDYDMVLMTRDMFTTIDFSYNTKLNMIEELVDKFYPGDELKDKRAKKKREKIRQDLSELFIKGIKLDKYGKEIGKADEIYFENIGFDMLMRDEAHDTKNLLIPLEMKVSGLNATDAKRSYQHYFASKIIRSQTGDRGVYSLTATPISNSPLEVFNMMLPFAEKELEKMNVNSMDDFIRRFADVNLVPTTDADGRVKMKNKFTQWKAPDELRNTFFRFVDYKTKDDVESVKANIKFPKENSMNVLSNLNPGQKEMMKHCQLRLWTIKLREFDQGKDTWTLPDTSIEEAVKSEMISRKEANDLKTYFNEEYLPKYNLLNSHRAEDEPPIDDVFFSVQSDMIKITSDLDWYRENSSEYSKKIDEGFVEQHNDLPKFKQIIEDTVSLYKDGRKQLIFAINTRLHDKIKQQLVEAGIPKEEIMIVNGKTAKGAKRKQISDDYNAGKYKVVIGNYATMGEGLNFNYMTSDIHHLQPAWNYLQIEQGNGRGIRQGNPLDTVNARYYNSRGSIDAFMNQKIKEKGKMVDMFMRGESTTWDEDANLQAEQMLIELSDNPEIAKRLYEQQSKKLQAVILEKEKTNNFRRFDELFDLKFKLSKEENKESKNYKAIQTQITDLQERLNNADGFNHKEHLTLDKKPIFLPMHDVVIPEKSVIKYGDDNEFAIIENYTPSTGNVMIQTWTPYETKRKTIKLKDFENQFGKTIEKKDFDTEEMFNKLINVEKTSDLDMLYHVPKEVIAKHRKQIIKNIKENYSGDVLYRVNGELKHGRMYTAEQEIDEEGGKFVFPQEDQEVPKYLFNIIKKNRDEFTYNEIGSAENIAHNLYGEDYENVIEKIVKKQKGETTTENIAA